MKVRKNRSESSTICPMVCGPKSRTQKSNKNNVTPKKSKTTNGKKTNGSKPATRNPYLNYFRKFYAQRGGKVSEAAKEAGANWRQMNEQEKLPYIEEAKKAPYVFYTKVKRLNQIFRILQPRPLSQSAKSKKVKKQKTIQDIQKLLRRWTRKVYADVIKQQFQNTETNENTESIASGENTENSEG